MQVQQSIEQKLQQQLAPTFLEIENESHQHNVPPGSESHFKVTIVSSQFQNVSSVKRHQQIYQILADELNGPVHALSLRCHTPEQWEAVAGQVHETPRCKGGSGQ